MAKQEDITFNVKVNEKGAVKSVDAINDSVEDLNENIDELGKSTVDTFKDSDKAIEGVADSYDDLAKSSKKAGKEQEESGKKGSKGLKLLGKGAKGLGTAFKAMGIGALIALFAALFEALKQNQAVLDIISKVVKTVSIVFNQVATALSDSFKNLKNNNDAFDSMKTVVLSLLKIAISPFRLAILGIKSGVLSAQLAWESSFLGGKDKEKIAELKDSLNDVRGEIIELGKDTIQNVKDIGSNIGNATTGLVTFVKDAATGIKDISIQASIDQAETLVQGEKNLERLDILLQRQMLTSQRNAELQRQIRDDETKSIDERIAANEELGNILDDQAQKELALINEKLATAELELSLNKDNIELQNEVLLLENEILDLDERITGQRSEQLANRNVLEKEGLEKRVEAEKEAADLSIEIFKDTEEDKLEIEKKALDDKVKNSALSEQEKTDALFKINKKYQDDLTLLNQISNEERLQVTAAVLGNTASLFKENTIAFKLLASAEATINTFLAATAAYKSVVGVPVVGPVLAPIAAGTAIATGLKSVAEINNVKLAGGGVLNGPSHANGGILTSFGELEGDEGVINKVSMANPNLRNLASAANEAGGGVAFGNGNGIDLSPKTIISIVNGINTKKVVLNINELDEKQNQLEIIDEESNI